jgi:hypothetical protein
MQDCININLKTCSYILGQISIIQKLSPCQKQIKNKNYMQVLKNRYGCLLEIGHIHYSQIYEIRHVWYKAYEFVITQIPTHSRCHSHMSQKNNWLS